MSVNWEMLLRRRLRELKEAEASATNARALLNSVVFNAYQGGMRQTEIAYFIGTSQARVSQIIATQNQGAST